MIPALVLTILREVVVVAASGDQTPQTHPGSSLISAASVMDSFTHQALTASYLSLPACLSTFCPGPSLMPTELALPRPNTAWKCCVP